jgi:uncharacterized SAM-binding protein YcdF (DUF218 family)
MTGIIMLLFFGNGFILNKLVMAYQPEKYELRNNEIFSAGILLGGFAGMNKRDHQTYYSDHADRFIQAAELYKTGHIKKIIIAAGDASIFDKSDFREADFARQQLINLGIPTADIFADRNSRNTAENAANAKAIIDSMRFSPPYLLITSALHMPRAQRTFEKAGLQIQAFPCAFQVTPMEKYAFADYFIPSGGTIKTWGFFLREIVGMMVYKITGRG